MAAAAAARVAVVGAAGTVVTSPACNAGDAALARSIAGYAATTGSHGDDALATSFAGEA